MRELQQYTNYADAAADAVDREQWLPSAAGLSFSQVFGLDETADNATATADANSNAAAHIDKPPPVGTWLLDSTSQGGDPGIRAGIPRLINKIYFQKDSGYPSLDSMPANLTAAHKSWQEMNPGYTVRYFDLDHARKYLHQHFHPVFLRAFDCLPAFAAKSDLFRMTLLYREGGWHSDWKQLCLQKNLLANISEVTDIFAAYDLWESNDFFKHKCVQNAFVGARPQHPVIEKMLEMLLTNIQTSRYNAGALDATSTCIFGRAIHVSEEERNSTWFSTVAGKVVNDPVWKGAFQWNGQPIVQHKCNNCGGTQDWGNTGNNYINLYKQRNFYCQDAASLFRTTERWQS